MLYAGISWCESGFEVAIVDEHGEQRYVPRQFAARETDAMITQLVEFGDELVALIDSTNGVVDGRMMAAGLRVRRVDPGALPERPLFGSVHALEIARAAQRGHAAVTPLERTRGSQTGREAELAAGIAASEAADAALTAAGRCLSHGPRDRDEVALTFDDGPLPMNTSRILDVLDSYGILATFFCVGMNAGAYHEQLERMCANGHSIGNHTWSHPILTELTRPQFVEQIARTSHAIEQASGGSVPTLFRPPHGARNPRVLRWLAELPATVALWDVAPDDWSMPGSDVIARTVFEQARPGSIILLHDGGGDRSQTIDALPVLIEGLLERGATFVSVDAFVETPARMRDMTDA